MSIFLKLSGKTFILRCQEGVKKAIQLFFGHWNSTMSSFILLVEGKVLDNIKLVALGSTIQAYPPLKGGKGGYGAKMKNQGGKKVRPNDNMFSRDINGRRISYSAMEKEYIEFRKKKKEEDQKVNKQRQQFRILENTIKQGQSFMKLDKKYHQQLQQTEKQLQKSLKIGRQRYFSKLLGQKVEKAEHTGQQSSSEDKIKHKNQEVDSSQFKRQLLNSQLQSQFNPIKKIKTTKEEIRLSNYQKPTLLSAKQKLHSLFKK